MTGKSMLTAAVSLMLTAVWAADPGAAAANAPDPADKLAAASDKTAADETAKKVADSAKKEEKKNPTEEELEKLRKLQEERIGLLQKIQKKRMELLKNNPKLRKMYLDILKQTQDLAIELDSDIEIRSLNRELREVETQLKEKAK